jgi:hypothetical protein
MLSLFHMPLPEESKENALDFGLDIRDQTLLES